MKYRVPKLSPKAVKENNRYFKQRIAHYRKRGLDFPGSIKFILEKAAPLKGDILEIGTGTGHTTLSLAKAGYKFISVDKDKEIFRTAALNLSYAKLLGSVKFYTMDAKRLKFKDNSFDNIIGINVFHHIDKAKVMFSEIDRVLRPSGTVVFADFNKTGLRIVDRVHRNEGRKHESSDTTKDTTCSYFYEAGYNIRRFRHKCHWILIAKKPD